MNDALDVTEEDLKKYSCREMAWIWNQLQMIGGRPNLKEFKSRTTGVARILAAQEEVRRKIAKGAARGDITTNAVVLPEPPKVAEKPQEPAPPPEAPTPRKTPEGFVAPPVTIQIMGKGARVRISPRSPVYARGGREGTVLSAPYTMHVKNDGHVRFITVAVDGIGTTTMRLKNITLI